MNSPEHAQIEQPPGLPVEPAIEAPSEPTIGQTLAAAREAHNLSLTDVANRLKLSVLQVQALEQGKYERLPGTVFVRGFARNYARLLNLDADATVRAIDAQLPRVSEQGKAATEANIPMPARNAGRWPILAGIAAAVFLGAALVDVLWPESPSSPTDVAPSTAPPPAGDAPVTPVPATPPATGTPAIASATLQTAAVASAETRGAAAVAATPQAAAAAGGRTVRFVFDQASWVQMRDASGKAVLEGLFPAGASREISAAPPLTLVIGNAPGVRLTYADRAVDLAPNTRDAVARLKLE